jgi:tetratricopeptide (TPR) repeat protein
VPLDPRAPLDARLDHTLPVVFPMHLPSVLDIAALAIAFVLAVSAAAWAEGTAAPGGSLFLPGPSLQLAPVPPHPADAEAAQYEHCMQLARDNPEAARTLAAKWHERGGAHPAEHCLAVALIGLGHYKEAAERLEKLAPTMLHAPATLRAGMLGQAAQAWLLAGEPGRAWKADEAALALRPDDPDLLVDRAEAAGAAGWYDKALADLDRVLKANPSRFEALLYRASADRKLGRLDPALADIEAALKLAPDSPPALLERGNIRLGRGDLDGARADWRRVAALAAGSAAAAAANDNLDRLATAQDGAPAAEKPAPAAKP